MVRPELWTPAADCEQGFVHIQDTIFFSGQGVWTLFPEGTRVCTGFWTKCQINSFQLQVLLSSSLVDYLLEGIQTCGNKKVDEMRTVRIIPPKMCDHGNNQNNPHVYTVLKELIVYSSKTSTLPWTFCPFLSLKGMFFVSSFTASQKALWCPRCYWAVLSGPPQPDGANQGAAEEVCQWSPSWYPWTAAGGRL